MIYVLTDGESTIVKYPYTIGLLRKDNPNTSFPKMVSEDWLSQCNVFKVVEVKPDITTNQTLHKPDQPIYQNGQWVLNYSVVDKTPEQLISENTALLNNKKEELRGKFEEAYVEPVTLPDGSIWNGGMNSALSIDGAVRMAENAGLTSIKLYDNSNNEHVVDIATGKNIAAAIGAAYQTKFALKQTLFKQLDSVNLGTATAKDQIEAVTAASQL